MDGAYRSRADARLLRGDGSPGVARGIGSVGHSRSCRVSLIDVSAPAAHRRSRPATSGTLGQPEPGADGCARAGRGPPLSHSVPPFRSPWPSCLVQRCQGVVLAVRSGLLKITGRSNSVGCPNALVSGSRIRHRGAMGESNEDANFDAHSSSAGMERG